MLTLDIYGFPFSLHLFLPTLNAGLNSVASVFLVSAMVMARAGRFRAHQNLMKLALAVSIAFLASYLTYHVQSRHVAFRGEGLLRTFYFANLIIHVASSTLLLPLLVRTFWLVRKGRKEEHKSMGKLACAVWMSASLSGVFVYLMMRPYYEQ